jgi:hypothetical protein
MLRLKKHKATNARRVILRSNTTGKIIIVRWLFSRMSSFGPHAILFSFFFITLRGCIELPHLSWIAAKAHGQDGRFHGSYYFT